MSAPYFSPRVRVYRHPAVARCVCAAVRFPLASLRSRAVGGRTCHAPLGGSPPSNARLLSRVGLTDRRSEARDLRPSPYPPPISRRWDWLRAAYMERPGDGIGVHGNAACMFATRRDVTRAGSSPERATPPHQARFALSLSIRGKIARRRRENRVVPPSCDN